MKKILTILILVVCIYGNSYAELYDNCMIRMMKGQPGEMFEIISQKCKKANSTIEKTSGSFLVDKTTGLMWQRSHPIKMKWQKAMDYCQNLSLAENSDWRLPDMDELERAYKIKAKFPDVDFPYYWSSTISEYDTYTAFRVRWSTGTNTVDQFTASNKKEGFNVLCVRSEMTPELGDEVIYDHKNNLMWLKDEPGKMKWQEAGEFCRHLSLRGYTDWRLPRIKELTTVYKLKWRFLNVISPSYWSSTNCKFRPDDAWIMFHGNANCSRGKSHKNYVRCVRGGSEQDTYPSDFSNIGDIVIHHSSGLIWQKMNDKVIRNFKTAISYCHGLTLSGYNDWRLPTISELQSIVDYSTYSPSINQTIFPATNSSAYWSSTTSGNWYVRSINFKGGIILSKGTSDNDGYVRGGL